LSFAGREPCQNLSGSDALAGLDEHLGDLQSLAFRPHQNFVPRREHPGHLQRVGEAHALGRHHRDGQLRGCTGTVAFRGRCRQGKAKMCNGGRNSQPQNKVSARDDRHQRCPIRVASATTGVTLSPSRSDVPALATIISPSLRPLTISVWVSD
jgi:hypothetical protein